jgi:hypothetical protein
LGNPYNTTVQVKTTATDLSSSSSYSSSITPTAATAYDVQLAGTYTGGLTFNANGASLDYGSLNDLDTTQSLVVSNSSGTAATLGLTDRSGTNQDLIDVSSGASLSIESGSGTLGIALNSYGNFNNSGTLNIASDISTANANLTVLGSGTTTITGNLVGNSSGAGTVYMNGTGILNLSGTNAIGVGQGVDQGLAVNSGTVVLQSAGAAGSSSITVGNAGLITGPNANLVVNANGATTFSNTLIVSGPGIDTISTTGTTTFSGTIKLFNNGTFVSSGSNGNLTISGAVGNGYNVILESTASALGASSQINVTSSSLNNGGIIENLGTSGALGTGVTTISANVGAANGNAVSGLVQNSATSSLILTASLNYYTGTTLVSAGSLTANSLGKSSAEVAAGASLTLQQNYAISSAASLTLDSRATASVDLAFSGADAINTLEVNGIYYAPGTYSVSQLNSYAGGSLSDFSGFGELMVESVPEPLPLSMLLAGFAFLSLGWGFRRGAPQVQSLKRLRDFSPSLPAAASRG